MTEKKSIRIAVYALADNKNLDAGQFKYYVTSVWGDDIAFNDDGYFTLWANGECIASDSTEYLHAIKAICADYEYELVKDIRS